MAARDVLPLQLDGARRVAGDCLAAAIDCLALTQHVKCSPTSARGDLGCEGILVSQEVRVYVGLQSQADRNGAAGLVR